MQIIRVKRAIRRCWGLLVSRQNDECVQFFSNGLLRAKPTLNRWRLFFAFWFHAGAIQPIDVVLNYIWYGLVEQARLSRYHIWLFKMPVAFTFFRNYFLWIETQFRWITRELRMQALYFFSVFWNTQCMKGALRSHFILLLNCDKEEVILHQT